MQTAQMHFNKQESIKKKQMPTLLQELSMYNILLYDGKAIHPQIAKEDKITCKTSKRFTD